MNEHGGKFEVTDHYELAERGGFVIGRIVAGVIRPGMFTRTGLEPPHLEVAGVEFLDNVSERKHWNALVFAERPSLSFVEQAFPVGSIIELE